MTKYELKADSNSYAAKVVRVNAINVLPNCDNVVGIPVFGFQAIVGKDTQVGDLFVVFPAESQLSHEFTSKLNLYRDETLNADIKEKGYLEKNRRIKALRFRGHPSNALAVPIAQVAADLTEGAEFDTLDGVEVVRKYVVPVKQGTQANVNRVRRSRVDEKLFPEHYDTAQYLRNKDVFNPGDILYITQKQHGTSVRIGRTWVNRDLKWWEKLLVRAGVKVQTQEIAALAGSRRVIKDPNNPNQQHWYGEGNDIWTDTLKKYEDLIPENVVVYGELIGWVSDTKPIQAGYTYDLPVGKQELYVYRVAVIGHDGGSYDLSWEGVKQFATERGLKHVPQLEVTTAYALEKDYEKWLDKRYHDEGYPTAVPLSDPNSVDEGVVILREGVTPTALKLKAGRFFEYETKLLDKGEEVLN